MSIRRATAPGRRAAWGAVAVPNLLEDLRRWADWIADAQPPAVALNAQTVRENPNFESWLLPGLSWLADTLPTDLPVIITGLSRADRIAAAASCSAGGWY